MCHVFSLWLGPSGHSLLRASACKNQGKLKFRGQSRKTFSADIVPISSYWQVTKRDVVCFQKDRFKLEEIDKIYFCCRQLQNSQNFRRNGPFSKLRLNAKGKKAS